MFFGMTNRIKTKSIPPEDCFKDPRLFHKIFYLKIVRFYRLTRISNNRAISPVVADILMVGIVMILAIFVLLLFHLPSFYYIEPEISSDLQIKGVYHVNEYGYLNYDSRVILINNGIEAHENGALYAEFYRNGEKVSCNIETMNGYDFISSHHYGVQTMGGTGCCGQFWNPNEKIALDFTDLTFRPGDIIKMDIFQRPSNKLISSHLYTA
jgi:hypothetical protein